jgi:hypothetical protein
MVNRLIFGRSLEIHTKCSINSKIPSKEMTNCFHFLIILRGPLWTNIACKELIRLPRVNLEFSAEEVAQERRITQHHIEMLRRRR